MQRGRDIGVDIAAEVAALSAGVDWEAELATVRDISLAYPAYYTQPFHAYPQGNLCWDAALEVKATRRCLFTAWPSLLHPALRRPDAFSARLHMVIQRPYQQQGLAEVTHLHPAVLSGLNVCMDVSTFERSIGRATWHLCSACTGEHSLCFASGRRGALAAATECAGFRIRMRVSVGWAEQG